MSSHADNTNRPKERKSYAPGSLLLFFPAAFILGMVKSGNFIGAFSGLMYSFLGFFCFPFPGIYAKSRISYLRISTALYLLVFLFLTSFFFNFHTLKRDGVYLFRDGHITIYGVIANLLDQSSYVLLYISIIALAWWRKDRRDRRPKGPCG